MLAVVLGSGGHTSELIKILSALPERHRTLPQLVLCSNDDHLSLSKYLDWREKFALAKDVQIHSIPRARQVGQSFWTSPFTTFFSLLWMICIFTKSYPTVILTNGPSISISIALAAYISSIMFLGSRPRAKIIYVESAARARSLSLSGRIMLHLADHLLVQWPELKEKYAKRHKNVQYSGLMV